MLPSIEIIHVQLGIPFGIPACARHSGLRGVGSAMFVDAVHATAKLKWLLDPVTLL